MSKSDDYYVELGRRLGDRVNQIECEVVAELFPWLLAAPFVGMVIGGVLQVEVLSWIFTGQSALWPLLLKLAF